MTTYTKFKEYIWLVNTIHQARAITLNEINEKWLQTDMSEGVPLSRTTFHRHRIAIEEMFDLYIECDKKNGNKYYIGNAHVLQEDSVQNWMLSTLSVGNMISESQSLNHRILLENIPSGGEKLQQIIKAMKDNRKIHLTYRRYGSAEDGNYTLAPYCIKLFNKRWYLLACFDSGRLSTFSLDRIKGIEVLQDKFKIDEDFDAEVYFNGSYGIVVFDEMPCERIVLRAYGYEPYYLRDLPLHHSQREINTTEEYTDFELRLKPTADFKTHLLSRGEWVEVLEPQSLADEIVEWHQKAIERYKKVQDCSTI